MTLIRMATTALLAGAVITAFDKTAGATEEAVHAVRLPSKVVTTDDLREDIESLAALSPTIGRQLAVIAGAPARVEVLVSGAPLLGFSRAETTISRYESGFIMAVVVIPPGFDFVELLAHELEHVVEQIEGVDLEALARTHQASLNAGGVFETARARDAGRAAAAEVEEAVRALRPSH